jgi:hypothetical protein
MDTRLRWSSYRDHVCQLWLTSRSCIRRGTYHRAEHSPLRELDLDEVPEKIFGYPTFREGVFRWRVFLVYGRRIHETRVSPRSAVRIYGGTDPLSDLRAYMLGRELIYRDRRGRV